MKLYILSLFVLFNFSIQAQPLEQPDAAEILHKIQKLKVLGSALYVAAHPDDENTRLIAWLSNELKVQTAYLSMTRGDGGQNLIGPEIREQLGIIRTQELLAARRIDRGIQFFTRANDFGYSKSHEETFTIWDEDKILADVVWMIRKFKPDVIITRFPVTGEGGHGHHTASALLANKAFKLAADPKAYPDQLKHVETWQPTRLMLNTGRWWNPDMTGNEPGVITIDVGEYNSLLGTSYTEIAAKSRSQHKSQGFGSTASRGYSPEYLEPKLGKKAQNHLFDHINISWQRVGAPEIEDKIESIISSYDPLNPAESIKSLLELRGNIEKIKNAHWKEIKIKAVDDIIKDCLSLYMEVISSQPYQIPSEITRLTLELTNRSHVPVEVTEISWPQNFVHDTSLVINNNEKVVIDHSLKLNEATSYSTPYWLRESFKPGYYNVSDQLLRGKAENDPAMQVEVKLSVADTPLSFVVPVEYKWNDPVEGELRRPIAIVPPVSLNFNEEIYLFPNEESKPVTVKVKNYGQSFTGEVSLDLPEQWRSEPGIIQVELSQKNEEQELEFLVYPPKQQSSIEVKAVVKNDKVVLDKEVDEIAYDHIPVQTMVTTANAEFVKLDVKIIGKRIGYIPGAGDAIPATLKELGYQVDILHEDVVNQGLQHFDAVVVGIRALNTNDRISYIVDDLLNYVHEGGTLIYQYNTSFRLKTNDFAPYPLQLSRDRVTVEEAPVKILAPHHTALNNPNKITNTDFYNWVQERGLYFPDKWDEKFVPLLGMNDPGESMKRGSLLIAPYGKGYFVYTGISWFRQLPAGVPGAIRIFVNLLSLSAYQQDAK